MSPTSAAQYRWAAELAPKKHYRIVSWIFGWITFWGWQLTTASPAYLGATMIQSLAVFNYPEYLEKYQAWHGTLIYWCIIIIGVVVNVGFAKWLPKLEGFLLVWHIAGFLAVLIPLIYLGPRTDAKFVFTSTADTDSWPNYGIAFCLGLVGNTFPFVGYDAASHVCIQCCHVILQDVGDQLTRSDERGSQRPHSGHSSSHDRNYLDQRATW